ncbi:hypothetical protein F0562_008519 [Nyssa sinensis]|uniref:Uncharacterized protein n=1 Tax=Nyssa sinensis TaxID=561372 RepID=A0A5J5A8E6_9ASTE|nr:hypothetical protein F0562_008519 [Nyssa sinensis]
MKKEMKPRMKRNLVEWGDSDEEGDEAENEGEFGAKANENEEAGSNGTNGAGSNGTNAAGSSGTNGAGSSGTSSPSSESHDENSSGPVQGRARRVPRWMQDYETGEGLATTVGKRIEDDAVEVCCGRWGALDDKVRCGNKGDHDADYGGRELTRGSNLNFKKKESMACDWSDEGSGRLQIRRDRDVGLGPQRVDRIDGATNRRTEWALAWVTEGGSD